MINLIPFITFFLRFLHLFMLYIEMGDNIEIDIDFLINIDIDRLIKTLIFTS